MIVIDEVAALRGLRYAVNLKGPGHHSPGRRYAVADYAAGTLAPCCMVGTALAHLGVAPSVMAACGNSRTIGVIALSLRYSGIEITPQAVRLLAEAQQIQDDHKGADSRWGAALRGAELLSVSSETAR